MSQPRALFRLRGARLEKLLHRAYDNGDVGDDDGDDDEYDDDGDDRNDDDDDDCQQQRLGPPIHPALF